jgi:methylase of polypeptide subunit release factors
VLVEVGHLELRAPLDVPGGRLDLPQQQLDQGGLARAIGADQADAVVSLFTAEGLTTVETHADDAGLPRITAARAPG